MDNGFNQRGTVNIEIVRKAFSGSKGTLLALENILSEAVGAGRQPY
jgi:hypothetical protein